MKKDSKSLSLIRKDIERELGIVMFYEQNLHLFPDKGDRDVIKYLVLASLKHASLFVEEFHRLQNNSEESQKSLKSCVEVLGNAMKEEKGAEDIYLSQSRSFSESLLKRIAKEEKAHQNAVLLVAEKLLSKLPKSDAEKLSKKYSF